MMQQNIAPFIQKKLEKIKPTLMMHLNQSIARLHQTYKNLLEKFWARLLIQLSITLLIFHSTIAYLFFLLICITH